MYLLVYKFGGSSVADAAGLRRAAKQLADAAAAGYHIVAVVSAQGKTTDRLLQTAAELTQAPCCRETDQLLATGEQASAALMLIVSRYGFDGQGDPSRVAAQIVSGIGFIGAGAIMVHRHSVHGLTTAAGVWVSAGIGMAVASGLYAIGIAATVLSLVGLEVLGWFFRNRRKAAEEEAVKNDRPPDCR